MKPYRKFGTLFQIRWKEALGRPECPYLYRWTIIILGFSIRLHRWIRSDDKRYFHDHSCDFLSIILKGKYTNVTPNGMFTVKAGSYWWSKGSNRHYLDIPKGGAWTLLFCTRPYRKWYFWITETRKLRPLEYFHRYKIPPCDCQ